MTESKLPPELDRLANAVHAKRHDGQLDDIRRFLDNYLAERKARESWRYRFKRWFRRAFTAH